MALVEKSPFDSKPTLGLGVNVVSAKRWTARMVPPGLAIALIAALYRLFSAGHPIIAIWTAGCVLAWLFVCGAGAAHESDRPASGVQSGPERR
ncbi:MAG: hypothetical protein WA733_04810 [Methylocystis sp.]